MSEYNGQYNDFNTNIYDIEDLDYQLENDQISLEEAFMMLGCLDEDE